MSTKIKSNKDKYNEYAEGKLQTLHNRKDKLEIDGIDLLKQKKDIALELSRGDSSRNAIAKDLNIAKNLEKTAIQKIKDFITSSKKSMKLLLSVDKIEKNNRRQKRSEIFEIGKKIDFNKKVINDLQKNIDSFYDKNDAFKLIKEGNGIQVMKTILNCTNCDVGLIKLLVDTHNTEELDNLDIIIFSHYLPFDVDLLEALVQKKCYGQMLAYLPLDQKSTNYNKIAKLINGSDSLFDPYIMVPYINKFEKLPITMFLNVLEDAKVNKENGKQEYIISNIINNIENFNVDPMYVMRNIIPYIPEFPHQIINSLLESKVFNIDKKRIFIDSILPDNKYGKYVYLSGSFNGRSLKSSFKGIDVTTLPAIFGKERESFKQKHLDPLDAKIKNGNKINEKASYYNDGKDSVYIDSGDLWIAIKDDEGGIHFRCLDYSYNDHERIFNDSFIEGGYCIGGGRFDYYSDQPNIKLVGKSGTYGKVTGGNLERVINLLQQHYPNKKISSE